MKLLCLKHFPKLLALYGAEPYGMHLGIHVVELLRLKACLFNQCPLLGNCMADIFHHHGRSVLHEIPQHHGLNRNTHVNHLLDVIQAQKRHIGSPVGNGLRKALFLQKPEGVPHRSPGHAEAVAYFIFTYHLARL